MAVAIKGIVDQNGVTHRFDHEYLDNNPTIPAVDDTLSTTGSAADAKATGDAVSSLREDLSVVEQAISLDDVDTLVTDKYITSLGRIADDANYRYALIDVEVGDKLILTVRGTATTAVLAQKVGNLYSPICVGEGAVKTYTHQADSNGTLAVSWNKNYTHTLLIVKYPQVTDTTLTLSGVPADAKKVGDELADVKEDLNVIEQAISLDDVSLDDVDTLVTDKYITSLGRIADDANYRYALIDVEVGDKLILTVRGTATTAVLAQKVGNLYSPICVGEGAVKTYTHQADSNGTLAVSWNKNYTHTLLIVKYPQVDDSADFNAINALSYTGRKIAFDALALRVSLDSRKKYIMPMMIGCATWKWTQLNGNTGSTVTHRGVTFTNNGDGTWTISGEKTGTTSSDRPYAEVYHAPGEHFFVEGHWYLLSSGNDNIAMYGYRYSSAYPVGFVTRGGRQIMRAGAENGNHDLLYIGVVNDFTGEINVTIQPICVDLTLLFGAGNEPHMDDVDTLKAIEAYASYNPSRNTGSIVEGLVTSISGKNAFYTPDVWRRLDGNGWGTYKTYNYFSYDTWTESNVTKSGWRFHKRVGKVVLNGTQTLKRTDFNNTETTSAWFYNWMGEKVETDINETGDLLSDILEPVPYVTNYSGTTVTKPSISVYYGGTVYGFLVRVQQAELTTEEQVNAYMAEHPATVYYALKTEEVIDLSGTMPQLTLFCENELFINTQYKIAVPSHLVALIDVDEPQLPMLSIIDDDGDKHFLTDVVPLITSKNAPIASAVTVQNIGNSHFMSYAEIDSCCDAGAEILNHTFDHPSDVSALNPNADTHKYYKALNTLLRHGYHACDILVYTSSTGEYTEWRECASKVFKCGIKIGGSKINYSDSDKFALARYRIDYADREGYTNWDYTELKALIDKCAANGGWMIWMFHTSNDIYRQRVETDGNGDVIYDGSGNPTPMMDGGNPVIDIDGTYPTMGSTVYIPMLADAIDYARTKGVEIVTNDYAYRTYFGA